MARNGVEFGIRVSGTGARGSRLPPPYRWPLFSGLRPGRRQPRPRRQRDHRDRRHRRLRDGWRPAIVRFVGGTPADAVGYTRAMYGITLTRNPDTPCPPSASPAHRPGSICGGRRERCGARDQYRHRPPRAGGRPDRRGHRARPPRLLRRRAPGHGHRARGHRLACMTTDKTLLIAIGGNSLILEGQRGTIGV